MKKAKMFMAVLVAFQVTQGFGAPTSRERDLEKTTIERDREGLINEKASQLNEKERSELNDVFVKQNLENTSLERAKQRESTTKSKSGAKLLSLGNQSRLAEEAQKSETEKLDGGKSLIQAAKLTLKNKANELALKGRPATTEKRELDEFTQVEAAINERHVAKNSNKNGEKSVKNSHSVSHVASASRPTTIDPLSTLKESQLKDLEKLGALAVTHGIEIHPAAIGEFVAKVGKNEKERRKLMAGFFRDVDLLVSLKKQFPEKSESEIHEAFINELKKRLGLTEKEVAELEKDKQCPIPGLKLHRAA